MFQVPLSSLPAFPKPAPGLNSVFASRRHSVSESVFDHKAFGSGRMVTYGPKRSSFEKSPESISS